MDFPVAPPQVVNINRLLESGALRRLQIWASVLCGLVVLLDGLDTQLVGYLAPALAKEWNLSRAALGPVLSASLVGLMAGLLFLAPLSDRIGRKPTILASVAFFGAFSLLTAYASSVTMLIAYRFLAGIGLGGAMPNALALTGEYAPRRRRATIVVAMFCGFSLGSILGGGLTAGLIAVHGWRTVFLIGGLLPLLLIPLLWMALPESLHHLANRGQHEAIAALVQQSYAKFEPPSGGFVTGEEASVRMPVAGLFQKGRALGTVLLWIIFFCNLLDFYFLQSWLPTLFTDGGLSIERAALVASLISVGGIVAGILSGPLMDRYGAYLVLGGLYLTGTVFVAAIGIATPGWLAVVTFLAGFCVSGGQKSVNALAVLFYPAPMRSTGVGWALGIGRLGSILGPVLAGWLIANHWTSAQLFQLAALPMLVAALLMFVLGRTSAG